MVNETFTINKKMESEIVMISLQQLLEQDNFTKDELIYLLSLENKNDIDLLFEKALKVKEKYFGTDIHLRGIIEISNHCEENCLYCGLRRANKNITRYRMSVDEVVNAALHIKEAGVKTVVLQSGEDSDLTHQMVTEMIQKIKAVHDCAITLSLGERSYADYKTWFAAGADRYLLKHETNNENLYKFIHSNQSLKNRLEHLLYMKAIGYQIGSGNIIGLPTQTLEDIAEDLVLCKQLDLDMASFSPFVSSEKTPFANIANASVDSTLKVMAVARLYLKNVHIPATTALATLDERGREKGILAGANVIMPSFTPHPYRTDYLIYDDKICIGEDPRQCISCLSIRISSVGGTISNSKGDSLKFTLPTILD